MLYIPFLMCREVVHHSVINMRSDDGLCVIIKVKVTLDLVEHGYKQVDSMLACFIQLYYIDFVSIMTHC